MQPEKASPLRKLSWKGLRLPITAMLLLVLAACAQVRLPSENPTVVSFQATPAAITVGESSTLSWEVTGADSVTIDGVTVDATGTMEVNPVSTTTYTLVATNRRGVTEEEVSIGVRQPDDAPLIAAFTADPQQIPVGGNSVLSWDVAGADYIRISPVIGTVPEAAGSRIVAPASTTVYNLIAGNGYGVVDASVTVTVGDEDGSGLPVIATFSAQPEGIELGESSTLSWSVEGATDITISPEIGAVGSEGSQTVAPAATQVYTLRATNAQGTATRNTTVHVREDPSSAPLIARFSASPATVAAGGVTTLSWFVVGADSVTIDQGVGAVSSEGSTSQQVDETTTFTLTATNAGGQSSASVTIQVADDSDPVAVEPTVAAFLADPASGTAPFSTAFHWVIQDPGSRIQSVSVAFGDGNVLDKAGLEASAVHTYTAEGLYTAVLTATLQDGGKIHRSTTVAVSADPFPVDPPVIDAFTVTPSSGRAPLNASFSFDVTGTGLVCTIDFGDGSGQAEIDPCATGTAGHRYTVPGVYTPSLTVVDERGNATGTAITVTVLPAGSGDSSLIADFEATPTAGDAPLDVAFSWTLEGSGAAADTWLFFGDGSAPFTGSGSGSVSHTYADPGHFRALLLAVNEAGDYDISLLTISTIDAASVPFAAVRTGSTLVELDPDERGLLAPLVGSLLGAGADLNVLSNEALLDSDINLLNFINALAINVGPDGLDTVLLDTIDIGEILNALLDLTAGSAAELPLQDLLDSLPGVPLPLELGKLLDIDLENVTDLRHVDINVLDLLILVLQTFNAQNVVGTPEPIELSLVDNLGGGLLDMLGLSGIVTGGLSEDALARIYLQVVEPPALTFARIDRLGEAQAGFRTAGVRVAVELEGLGLSIDTQDESASGLVGGLLGLVTGLLSDLGLVGAELDLGLSLAQLSLFAEVGTYEGYVSAIDLDAPSVTVESSGALAHLHLGNIAKEVFFDRSRTAVPEVDFGNIATLSLDLSVSLLMAEIASIRGDVAVGARATTDRTVAGQSLVINGPFPATAAVGSDGLGTLVNDLLADLELAVDVSALALDLPGGVSLDLADLAAPILGIVEDILDSVLGLTTGGDSFGASLPLDQLLEGLLDNTVFRILGINFNENDITVIDVVDPTR